MRRERHEAELDGYESGPDATQRATAAAMGRAESAHGVVLVEGISDQIAIEMFARRVGRDLRGERFVVVPIGGAHAVSSFVADFAERPDIGLYGLCDAAELSLFEQATSEVGRDMPVFVCRAARRSARYARFIIDEADLDRVPLPLRQLVDCV